MDERCKLAHGNLLAGICPWSSRVVTNGVAEGDTLGGKSADVDSLDVAVSKVRSLRQLVADTGPLDFRQAARFAEEIARQLTTIHKIAPFHGAVSPENVFIDDSGRAQLGPGVYARVGNLSDVIGRSAVIEEMVDAAGAADYLAPEQVLCSASADQRIDMYSLGCTLYFMLIGRPPFGEGSISERLLKHQTADPAPILSLRSDVPQALANVCQKMMAKKPSDRYSCADDLAAALAHFQS
jgi:eukaryotic-like serine/threonine-protein kinase